MYNLNSAFEKELRTLVQAEIDRLKDNLANGLSTPDYESYKHTVGKIAGLAAVLEMCEEVQTTLSKKY
jgi:hypothetical protein